MKEFSIWIAVMVAMMVITSWLDRKQYDAESRMNVALITVYSFILLMLAVTGRVFYLIWQAWFP